MLSAGWTKDNKVLLVSHDGYSVSNPTDGKIIIENYSKDWLRNISKDNLEFELNEFNEIVKIFGLFGGDGNHVTSDRWKLEVVYPAWPNSLVLIREPKAQGVDSKRWEAIRIIHLNRLEYSDLKCGFSYDENYFMIINSSGAEIFSRLS